MLNVIISKLNDAARLPWRHIQDVAKMAAVLDMTKNSEFTEKARKF